MSSNFLVQNSSDNLGWETLHKYQEGEEAKKESC